MSDIKEILSDGLDKIISGVSINSAGVKTILKGTLNSYFSKSDLCVITTATNQDYNAKIELKSGNNTYLVNYINGKSEIKHPQMNDTIINKFKSLSDYIISLIKGNKPYLPEDFIKISL